MTDLLTPLTNKELDFLDDFLLDRINETEDTRGKDEGLYNVSALDGLLTALVSAPMTIPQNQWLPLVWGDYVPAWKDKDEFMAISNLFTRHMDMILMELNSSHENFQPIFLVRKIEDKEIILVDDWCDGYVRGMGLIYSDLPIDDELNILLTPIIAFGTQAGWEKLKTYKQKERDNIRQAITPNARKVFEYWSNRRENNTAVQETYQHKKPKVSRNAPCPCGSGKKFKKCCLH